MHDSRSWLRSAFLPCLLALSLSSGAAPQPAPQPPAEPQNGGRVVVLGFDGADARTIRELLERDAARYPTFARLAESGTLAPLLPVAPPESPVSWAALNTGQNPAKTGVPGFVARRMVGDRPMPGLGHLKNETKALAELAGAPLPTWDAPLFGAIAGGAVFLVVLALVLLLLRGRMVLAFVVALLAGGAAAWGGHRVRGYLPESYPRTTNPNQARNLWDFAAEAGRRCVVLDAAQAFDMPAPDGAEMLAGLGVPDARGGIGQWFVYTTNPDEFNREGRDSPTAGTIYRVDERDGEIRAQLHGPTNFWQVDRLTKEKDAIDGELKEANLSLERSIELSTRMREVKDALNVAERDGTTIEMVIRRGAEAAEVTIGGATQTVAEGEWSEFYELEFRLNPLISVHALTRVRVVHLDQPYFELFVNVLDIDPRKPPFWQPISSPADFSARLASDCGLYETYGWPTATMPVKDREVDPELLMEDVEFTLKWRERLTHATLARTDWELCMSVFSTTDRVQHMMYRYYDPENPLYDAAEAARELEFFGETITFGDAIPAIYRQMDRVVGDVLARMRSEDTLLVCSDHGFQSFHRQVNINNWLAEEGYLAVADPSRTSMLGFVDWSNTRAYSLGMGFIYLNLRGREPKGTVDPTEAPDLIAEIREKLLAATDPENGNKICDEVYVTAEIHSGPHLDLESDLIVGFAPRYRVSWSTTSGGITMTQDDSGQTVVGPVCQDNDSPWSGDHISMAVEAVAGVLLSNRPLSGEDATPLALQIAPTALALLGVPVPAAMDAAPLRFR